MEPAIYIPSERGGKLLKLDEHLLSTNYKNGNRNHWKCRIKNCKVTAITERNIVVNKKGEHIHGPSQTALLKSFMHAAKEDARIHPLKPMKRVFNEALQEMNIKKEETLYDLPSMKKYKSTLYRARAKRLSHDRSDIQAQWSQSTDVANGTDTLGGDVDDIIQPEKVAHNQTNVAHHQLHSGEKPFQCNECEKTYTKSSTLLQHRRKVHKRQKLLECTDCGKDISLSSELSQDQQYHIKEKYLQCNECALMTNPLTKNEAKDLNTNKKVLFDYTPAFPEPVRVQSDT